MAGGNLLDKLRGTLESLFFLGGPSGPQLKSNSGVIEHRNTADTGFVLTRSLTPAAENDGVVKMYADLDSEPAAPNTTYSNTRSGSQITNETWKRTADSTNLKTIDYTYTGTKLTTEVRKVYAAAGTTVVAQMTINYTYTGSNLTGETITRDV